MGAIALAIKIEDPGPVLFTQKRVGQNKQYTRTSPNKDTVDIFAGIVKCGTCGRSMTIRIANKKFKNGTSIAHYSKSTGYDGLPLTAIGEIIPTPILFTLSGIVMDVRLEQPQNALAETLVTPSSITTL